MRLHFRQICNIHRRFAKLDNFLFPNLAPTFERRNSTFYFLFPQKEFVKIFTFKFDILISNQYTTNIEISLDIIPINAILATI